jgi:hypothetical protein
MGFELKHPKKRKHTAAYGWDRALGFFVEIADDGIVVAESTASTHRTTT